MLAAMSDVKSKLEYLFDVSGQGDGNDNKAVKRIPPLGVKETMHGRRQTQRSQLSVL